MWAAIIATVLFSLSVVCGTRSARYLGANAANFWRLVLAAVWLALWAHGFGLGCGGNGFAWFFLSGLIGFGLGDITLFHALARIGSRLTILLTQCLAAPLGALVEWLWLGTALSLGQLCSGAVILAGVGIAIGTRPVNHRVAIKNWSGIAFAVVAALGQGLGAVLSRKAFAITAAAGQSIDGGTAAYQRVLGGLLFGGICYAWVLARKAWNPLSTEMPGQETLVNLRPALIRDEQPPQKTKNHKSDPDQNHAKSESLLGLSRDTSAHSCRQGDPGNLLGQKHHVRRAWPWVLLNSLAGPTFGVACYQWALKTNPTGIVLPLVATTPLVVIPFAWYLEADRPTWRSLLGGVLAVFGAIALAKWS